jgi:hypothetical protein
MLLKAESVFHKFFPSVCVSARASLLSLLGKGSVNTFPRQRIHATIKELLDALSYMRSVSYQKIICGVVCASPYRCYGKVSKDVPAATKNYWRRRFLAVRGVPNGSRRLVFPEKFWSWISRRMKPGMTVLAKPAAT